MWCVGAVLSHVMEDGEGRPVAYASRTLSVAEKNYSQPEKEALVVVHGVNKFHYYIYDRHFIIQSDHQPLSYLFSNSKAISPTTSSRIKRWSLTLRTYSYTITHKPGKNLGNADALSWLPQPVTTESDCLPGDLVHLVNHLTTTTITAAHIQQWTDTDSVLSKVHNYLQWPSAELDREFKPFTSRRNEFSIMDGYILYSTESSIHFLPPITQPPMDRLRGQYNHWKEVSVKCCTVQ